MDNHNSKEVEFASGGAHVSLLLRAPLLFSTNANGRRPR